MKLTSTRAVTIQAAAAAWKVLGEEERRPYTEGYQREKAAFLRRRDAAREKAAPKAEGTPAAGRGCEVCLRLRGLRGLHFGA